MTPRLIVVLGNLLGHEVDFVDLVKLVINKLTFRHFVLLRRSTLIEIVSCRLSIGVTMSLFARLDDHVVFVFFVFDCLRYLTIEEVFLICWPTVATMSLVISILHRLSSCLPECIVFDWLHDRLACN